jgi:hypothetical protein
VPVREDATGLPAMTENALHAAKCTGNRTKSPNLYLWLYIQKETPVWTAISFASGSSFRNFTGDILICPAGVVPPGRRSPPSFPFLRYADKIEGEGEAELGFTWGFRHINPKSGKGYPDTIGIGWFGEQGRARGRFLLRMVSGFKGIVIICPPGIKPPPGPFAPLVTTKQRTEIEAEGDPDEDAEV